MIYINSMDLIRAGISGGPVDAAALLKTVDREKVLTDLRRKKIDPPSAFRATDEPIPDENFARLPGPVQEELTDIHYDIQKRPHSHIRRIKELKDRYPNVPYLYNLLANAYNLAGDKPKFFEAIQEEHRRFPEYLFGKTHLAEYYLEQEKPDLAAKALEHKFDINEHFPSGKGKYHISEIMSFYSVAGAYFAAIDEPARALACYFIINGCKPDHPMTKRLGLIISAQQIKEFLGKMRRMQKEE